MKTSNKIALATALFSIGLLYASVHALIGDVKTTEAPLELKGAFKHIKIMGGVVFGDADNTTVIKNVAHIRLEDATENKVIAGRDASAFKRRTIINDTLFLEFNPGHTLRGLPTFDNGKYTLKPDVLIASKDLESISLVNSSIAYSQQKNRKLRAYAAGRSSLLFIQELAMDSLTLYFNNNSTFDGSLKADVQNPMPKKLVLNHFKVVGKDNATFNFSGLNIGQSDFTLEDGVVIRAKQAFLGLPSQNKE